MAKRKATTLEEVAYHEAGHAAIYHHFGEEFVHVTIVPDPEDGSLGHIKNEKGRIGRVVRLFERNGYISFCDMQVIEEECIMCLAGGLAGARYTGQRNYEGEEGDRNSIIDLLEKFYFKYPLDGWDNKTIRAFYAYTVEKTRVLVELRWPQIEALAKALLEKKTLDFGEASVVMQEAESEMIRTSREIVNRDIAENQIKTKSAKARPKKGSR